MSRIKMKFRELKKADSATLRKFGLVIAVPLALIGIYLIWKVKPAASYLLIIAGLFAFLGLFFPRILKPIYIVWMMLAYILSIIMTNIILTIFFIIVVTPIAVIMRILRKDLLSRKFPGKKDSYWVEARSYPDEIDRYSKPF